MDSLMTKLIDGSLDDGCCAVLEPTSTAIMRTPMNKGANERGRR
jgi:hypothetical protein